jgi:hypothetical protein
VNAGAGAAITAQQVFGHKRAADVHTRSETRAGIMLLVTRDST